MSDNVGRLGSHIAESRDALLAEWRSRVRNLDFAANLDLPTLSDHVPVLLDDIAQAFQQFGATQRPSKGETRLLPGKLLDPIDKAAQSATKHGTQRFQVGFDLTEMIAEYSLLRDVLFDFAIDQGITFSSELVANINSVMDVAISQAARAHASLSNHETRRVSQQHSEFVAHDLRTPLQAVSLCALQLQLEAQTTGQSDSSAKALGMLTRNVDRIVELVETFVDPNSSDAQSMQAAPTAHPQDVMLWPLIDRLLVDVEPVARTHGVTIINQVDNEVSAYVDAPMLSRVLQNLLSNAIQASGEGLVSVVSGRTDDRRNVLLTVINDRGAIPDAQQQRLLRRIDSTDASMGGHGLDIIREFVAAMGGSVDVHAGKDTGTSIGLILPMSSPETSDESGT